ncbi:enoyl-CoA hydratase-related protein [Tunicatimonas pelagia]|uniref:enoyl-CoA hydratase-related protein n=1 Tax=Tunicatimonas pelagia TaxID=931531 RepID=UPI002665C00B|nr:enoyl-CoA hydratase-related protein [Tunicatimonas pelagia]WKN42014.1 enoyl-CoA hydratase-related protein [Tunicatimonas pelagia]
MHHYETIELEINHSIATLWLNRPEVRNAFNNHVIVELMDCLQSIEHQPEITAVVIRGRGKTFCAGADIQWMKSFSSMSHQEDFQENIHLARCFYMIYTYSKPTIALVHGAAFGGANGLLAACDMAYCLSDTKFAFSEVKIGIIPATISPYIVKRMGEFNARELMLTGRRFSGEEAAQKGLVNATFSSSEALSEYVNQISQELKSSAPGAMSNCKDLIFNITKSNNFNETIDYTARMIADARASEEGQEGMSAFLEKRKPNWVASANANVN